MSFIIVFWGFFMIGFMAIGGYFMFRKFLKQLPKEDGKSMMDWELHYIEKTKHMWEKRERELLEELVSPVPELFRDVARQKIASRIGQVSIEKGMDYINQDVVIEGYILATPKRDHKFLRKKLKEKKIDVTPYEPLFKLSKEGYRANWEASYKKN
ncbi:DUF2621 family protein [Ornithinibacillus californiensis]|uniref:DUF2621 family protein n=1 Tax=Ornithinibacillus californiensis TaxID=161536 RepID=UPI00064E02F3|nr:DUF2621 family protein [Ornithinibacillus californiensis]